MLTVSGPQSPVSEAGGYIHRCSGNRSPPSVKISCESGVGGIGRSSHEVCWGRGNAEVNMLRKLVGSGEKNLSSGSKDREAKLAGRLFFPAQCGTVGTWLSRVRARMARARRSRALVGRSDREIRRWVQLTAGELSENIVVDLCRRGMESFNTNHATRIPAISKSLLVILALRKRRWMFSGHW